MNKTNVCRRCTALVLTILVLSALTFPCMAMGNMAGGNGSSGIGNDLGNAAKDIGRAVEDILPGDSNNPGESAYNPSDNTPESDTVQDHTERETGVTDDGNTTGNAQNGVVGESDTDTAMESETNPMNADAAEKDNGGINWIGIIIALLVIAALAAVVLALIPKKKNG